MRHSLPFHIKTSEDLKTFKTLSKIRIALHVIAGFVRVDLD